MFEGSKMPLKDHMDLMWHYVMISHTVSYLHSSSLYPLHHSNLINLHENKQLEKTDQAVDTNRKWKRKYFRYYRIAIRKWLHEVQRGTKLGGPGMTVEIDESCFTKKRKYNRGSGGPKPERWVFGIVERRHEDGTRGRVRLWLVEDRTRSVLIPIINNNIHRATKIISDNYVVYHTLRDMGWDHEMVNHSMEFVESWDRNVHTEGIEGTWMHVKRWLNHLGGTRDAHIQERLDEWRFHRDYMTQREYNFWRFLVVIGKKGYQAKISVDTNQV